MALTTVNFKGQLAGTPTAIVTVDLNESWIIQNISISNNSGSTVNDIRFYIHAGGGTANDDTQFINIGSMKDDTNKQISLKHNLNSLDVLAARATTADAINYIVSVAQRTD